MMFSQADCKQPQDNAFFSKLPRSNVDEIRHWNWAVWTSWRSWGRWTGDLLETARTGHCGPLASPTTPLWARPGHLAISVGLGTRRR